MSLRPKTLLLLVWLTMVLWASSGPRIFGQSLEYRVYRSVHVERNRGLDGVFNTLSITTYPLGVVSPGVVFLGAKGTQKKKLWYCLAATGSIGLAMTASTAAKLAVARQRPYLQYGGATPINLERTYSMPSGHTTAAFNMAINNTLYLKEWYYIVPSYLYAAGVGYSRIHLGAHFLTDVVVGALNGTASGLITYWAQDLLLKRRGIKLIPPRRSDLP